jgi:hypothetical protein
LNARRLSAAALTLAVATVPLAAGHAEASVSKTQAKKSAKAAVLTAKDFPGYIAFAGALDPDGAHAEQAFYKCTGAKTPTFVLRDFGTGFMKDDQEIDSSADVATSAKAAKADFRALASSKTAACWKKVVTSQTVSTGGAVDALKVKVVRVTVPGADDVTALHLTGKFYSDRTLVHIDSYELNGIVGAVEFTLTSTGYETKAPSLSKLESLARTVVKRVHAA